jgi:ABC-type lipoprotein export system ATPase subunit
MIPYENPPLRIDLGTLLSDPDIRVVLTEQELGEHVTILGQSGSGKSRLLQATPTSTTVTKPEE